MTTNAQQAHKHFTENTKGFILSHMHRFITMAHQHGRLNALYPYIRDRLQTEPVEVVAKDLSLPVKHVQAIADNPDWDSALRATKLRSDAEYLGWLMCLFLSFDDIHFYWDGADHYLFYSTDHTEHLVLNTQAFTNSSYTEPAQWETYDPDRHGPLQKWKEHSLKRNAQKKNSGGGA